MRKTETSPLRILFPKYGNKALNIRINKKGDPW